MHGGGEGVVGGLGHVDVVVGVNGLFGSEGAAGQFDGPVGDDLVDVHVRLGAAAGLPDAEGEVVVELALRHFRGGLGDPTRLVFGEKAELGIGEGAGLLEQAKRVDERGGHAVVGNVEVVKGAFRLGPVIPVGRHLDFTHRVGFCPLLAGLGVFRRHGRTLMGHGLGGWQEGKESTHRVFRKYSHKIWDFLVTVSVGGRAY